MSRRDDLMPVAERELEALDRALAGEPVDETDLADLALLVDDVRATAPPLPPALAARLEEDLAGARVLRRRRREAVLSDG